MIQFMKMSESKIITFDLFQISKPVCQKQLFFKVKCHMEEGG